MSWPRDVIVGHTLRDSAEGARRVILDCPRKTLTPDEARAVARELLLRADYQDRTSDTRAGDDQIPRRV